MLGVTELRTDTHILALRQRADSRARWAEVVQAMEETVQRAWLKREGLEPQERRGVCEKREQLQSAKPLKDPDRSARGAAEEDPEEREGN